jgi:hypothetical protein
VVEEEKGGEEARGHGQERAASWKVKTGVCLAKDRPAADLLIFSTTMISVKFNILDMVAWYHVKCCIMVFSRLPW